MQRKTDVSVTIFAVVYISNALGRMQRKTDVSVTIFAVVYISNALGTISLGFSVFL